MCKIVLNIPHCSINGIFDSSIGKWKPNPYFINECVNKLTDWYTDFLFPENGTSIQSVVFPYSRFVCDVERLKNDPLEKDGQGIIYTEYNGVKRGEMTEHEKEILLQFWNTHQEKLGLLLENESVLLDCHSFLGTGDDKDICIGYCQENHYSKDIVNNVIKTFKKYGYSVSVNTPFSGSIIPDTNVNYTSLMIEVDKRIYLNNKTNRISFDQYQSTRWFACINEVYNRCMK